MWTYVPAGPSLLLWGLLASLLENGGACGPGDPALTSGGWFCASALGLETYADKTVERRHRPKPRLFTVCGEGGGRTPGRGAVKGWVLPWPTLHLFVFSLGPMVFSESVPVRPSVGPVLMCMRRKGAAVRLAFSREGQGSSCGDQGRPGCPFPRQAAGAMPSPGNIQGH